MTISKVSTLVSVQWLKQQIGSKLSSNLRVLDTSWLPEPDYDGYKIYQEGHIPTSLHFDLKKISTAREGCFDRFPIPEPKCFKGYVEDLGISNHTQVIVYNTVDNRPSFRTWFLFRLFGHNNVSLLNGGIHQWKAHGFPLTKEEPNVEKGEFVPKFQGHLLRDYEFMTRNMKTKQVQVADSRPPQLFQGTDEAIPGGHIPGSVNIPFSELYQQDGTFTSVGDLKTLFGKAQIDLNKPLVATCQMGMTACSLAAAAFMLGKEDVPLYNGSFTEWGVRAEEQNIIKAKNEE